MSLFLSPELEQRLIAAARSMGLSVDDYLDQLLLEHEQHEVQVLQDPLLIDQELLKAGMELGEEDGSR